jgi:PAS domain S-box-containing protein
MLAPPPQSPIPVASAEADPAPPERGASRARPFAWHLGALTLGLLVPSLLFIGILLLNFTRAERGRIEGEARNRASLMAVGLDREVANVATTLRALATSPSLQQDDLVAFHAQAVAIHQQLGFHVGVRNPIGELIVTSRLPPDRQFPPTPVELREVDDDARAREGAVVSDVFTGVISSRPAVQVAVPILNDAPPRRVVGASLDLDYFRRALPQLDLAEGWTAAIMDRDGVIVARSPDGDALAGKSASPQFQANATGEGGLYYGINSAGVEAIIAHQRSQGAGWRVAVSYPVARLNEAIYRSVLVLGLAGALLGGIGFTLAFSVRSTLAEAVRRVKAQAESIGGPGGEAVVATRVSDLADISESIANAARRLTIKDAELAARADALQASQLKLRRVIDNMSVLVGLLDFNGNVVDFNEGPFEMFGIEPRQLIGKPFWDCWWEGQAEQQGLVREACLSAQAGQTVRFDMPVRLPDGRSFVFDLQLAPLRDERGEIVGIQPTAVDITQRKSAEDRLRESEERLRTFADSNLIGIIFGRTDGEIEYANDAFLKIIGQPRATLEAGRLRWDRMTPPEWLQIDQERIAEAQRLGFATPYEKEYLRPDGSRVPVLVGYTLTGAMRDRSIAFILDLTERKRLASELEGARERLILAHDAAGVVSWSWTPQDGSLEVSNNYAALFDLGEAAPSLEAVLAKLHPDDAPAFRAAMERAMWDSAAPMESEFRIALQDGGHRWILGRGHAFRDAEGRLQRMTGINIDITGRKQLEERQRLLVRELHHRLKNLLATVQAVSGATMRSAPTMEAFRRSFGDRLMSLARTHSLVTDNAWEGARIGDLVRLEVAPYLEGERIVLEGPEATLPPETAIAVGMALHELATNAVKHGALSVPSGRIAIDWRVTPGENRGQLELRWVESGGPCVSQPERRGFGSQLLERIVGSQINGECHVEYRPEGVVATLTMSLMPSKTEFRAETIRALS